MVSPRGRSISFCVNYLFFRHIHVLFFLLMIQWWTFNFKSISEAEILSLIIKLMTQMLALRIQLFLLVKSQQAFLAGKCRFTFALPFLHLHEVISYSTMWCIMHAISGAHDNNNDIQQWQHGDRPMMVERWYLFLSYHRCLLKIYLPQFFNPIPFPW